MGFVWATMLWELTWELIGQEGFDPDLYHGTGGNNTAMCIVKDGMKPQACNPGFVDGRDAILQADELDYGGTVLTIDFHGVASGLYLMQLEAGGSRVLQRLVVE